MEREGVNGCASSERRGTFCLDIDWEQSHYRLTSCKSLLSTQELLMKIQIDKEKKLVCVCVCVCF